MQKQPVVIVMSILAAYQVLVAGSALADFVGAEVAGLLVLLGAAVQAGMQFYVKGKVTPEGNLEDNEAGLDEDELDEEDYDDGAEYDLVENEVGYDEELAQH